MKIWKLPKKPNFHSFKNFARKIIIQYFKGEISRLSVRPWGLPTCFNYPVTDTDTDTDIS